MTRIPPEVRVEAERGVPVVLKKFLSSDEIRILRITAAGDSSWSPGRQHTGYEKLDLRPYDYLDQLGARMRLILGTNPDSHSDLLLLRYPRGSYIPTHVDEAGLFGLRHVRLNALVTAADCGGLLYHSDRPVQLDVGDALYFYPDESSHAVGEILSGERLVLTCGAWVPR